VANGRRSARWSRTVPGALRRDPHLPPSTSGAAAAPT
jgi:hypothetical protein